jgi:hypothetical protein
MTEQFLINTVWYDSINEFSDEDLGILFRNLFLLNRGEENLINLNKPNIKLVFNFIKSDNLIFDRRKLTSANNGALGGRPKGKPNNNLKKPKKPKPPSTYIYNNTNNNAIEDRVLSFKKAIWEYAKDKTDKFPKEMLRDFAEYWTEVSEGGLKMRFEKEKVFGISMRLSRWKKNNFGNKTTPPVSAAIPTTDPRFITEDLNITT